MTAAFWRRLVISQARYLARKGCASYPEGAIVKNAIVIKVQKCAMRVSLQPFVHLPRQAVHTAPHVGVAGLEPRSHPRQDRDHRRNTGTRSRQFVRR
jgi:hypothetical protein